MISKETVQLIKEKADIVQVISQYVSLQKSGSGYKGLCPFHSEKTPSFHVNPVLKFYHCFGCGASGDVIKFVQEIEHLSFRDAVMRLARQVGIDIPISTVKSDFTIYTTYLSKVHAKYISQLNKSKEATAYLKARGFTNQQIDNFELGYCPERSTIAVETAREMTLPLRKAASFGLIKQTNGKYFDRFSNRIIIPIRNDSENLVAFGARTLGYEEPKYLNSPETRYFSKGSMLFLFHTAKKVAKKLDFIVLTEGYFDALAFHRAGITNAVAILGTALTPEHVAKISSSTKNVILCFDSDDAGERATIRALELLVKQRFNVAIANLTEDDPDSLYQKRGPSSLKESLKTALQYEKYIVSVVSRKHDLSVSAGVEEFLAALKPWAQLLLSQRRFERYNRFIESVSATTNLSAAQIDEFFRSRKLRTISKVEHHKRYLPSGEEYLVYLYLTHEDMRNEIHNVDKSLLSERSQLFFEKMRESRDQIDDLDEELKVWALKILEAIPPGDPVKILNDVKKQLQRKSLERRISEIDLEFTSTEDSTRKMKLLSERQKIARLLDKLGGGTGAK
ncbi:MAG: DNA primase [Thermotogaceae bacterium]|nr:DNA primase [Thermotogaceae bacterium]